MGWGYNGTQTFHPRYDTKNWSIYILDILSKYSGKTCLSDHFLPIVIVRNLLRPPLLGTEVRGDVIFSQSGDDCPVIPPPHCRQNNIPYYRTFAWRVKSTVPENLFLHFRWNLFCESLLESGMSSMTECYFWPNCLHYWTIFFAY